MATKQQAAPAAGGVEEGMLAHLSKMAWQALPAIASAISFVGFVAVVGAAIEWVRFDSAHLPATQAMLALPRQELVAIGALALGSFVVGAVIAVLLVYLLDNKGNASAYTARGLVAVAVAEIAVTLFFIGRHPWWTYLLLSAWLIAIGVVAAFVVSSVMRNFMSRSRLKRAGDAAIKAREALAVADDAYAGAKRAADTKNTELVKHRAEARGAAYAAKLAYERSIAEWNERADQVMEHRAPSLVGKMANAKQRVNDPSDVMSLSLALLDAEKAAGHAPTAVRDHLYRLLGPNTPTDRTPVVCAWIVSVVAFALILTGVLWLALDTSLSWLVILLVIASGLAMMNLFAARATEMFVWYGVSVFFSVLLFGAALTIARTLVKPSVQPIALVRKNDGFGICGVYVTQTKDRIYIGRLPYTETAKAAKSGNPTHVSEEGQIRPGLLFWVPTTDVELVYVGQFVSVDPSLRERSARMLTRLYLDRAKGAPATSVAAVAQPATGKSTAGKSGTAATAVAESSSSPNASPSCIWPPKKTEQSKPQT
jgi:hypothetical protein